MKILVYDTAAEYGGALKVLRSYYDKALLDKDNEWTFVVSNANYLPSNENIKVIEQSFPKKSWLHRLYFDKFKVSKVIDAEEPDLIYNLQNIYVKNKRRAKQIIFLHQSIPFTKVKISVFDFKIWVYKNIIGKMIFKSIKKCDGVIVQTNWIKEAILEKKLCQADKITISKDFANIKVTGQYKGKSDGFFYPADAFSYKDHFSILKASKVLKNKGKEVKLFFTLKGNENKLAKKLYKFSNKNKLNVTWLGMITPEQVMQKYAETTLVFPSYLETFGLPMLEARLTNAPIIASDTPFAKEVLEGYQKVSYFPPKDYLALAKLMEDNLSAS